MAAIGDYLLQIAKAVCSDRLRQAVLEPAIADLQHDVANASSAVKRRRALANGYIAFWRSFVWCLGRDVADESSVLHATAGFLVAVAAIAAAEALLLHTSWKLRGDVLQALAHGPWLPYLGWRAHLNSLTLTFGVPFAMVPAMYCAARKRRVAPVTVAALLICGMSITALASGWVAPALVRWEGARDRARFIEATGGKLYLPPDDVDGCPDCKTWPDLIRGANAPLKHRYPGYPNYVAPEDRGLPQWHRSVIRERLLLIVLAPILGLAGWWLGLTRASRRSVAFTRP